VDDIDRGRLRAECGYSPIELEVTDLAAVERLDRLLMVGDVAELGRVLSDLMGRVLEVRLLADPDVDLPRGLYWFSMSGVRQAMVVCGPAAHGDPISAAATALDQDHPLSHARGWIEHWWESSPGLPVPSFAVMDEAMLTTSGEVVTLRSRQFTGGQWMYEARVDGRHQSVSERSLREVPGTGGPLQWVREPPVSADRFSATLTRAKLRDRFTDTVFSFRASRTLFRSYQFKPIMKLLQTGRSRLLIADEVGLGKTIEAGLVWTELEARRNADRVLVVCPAVLVLKWKQEMEERFGFELVELDGPGLDSFLDRISTGRLPRRVSYIVSLQRLRAWQGLKEAADFAPEFDLIIVDEAHAMRNTETASFALGSILSEWAESLIFLTATPVNLRSRDLYSLMRLLVPGELGDEFTFELQLEPNALLHRLQVSLFDRSVTAGQRLSMLDELGSTTFGAPLMGRPETRLLRELLADEVLLPATVARARRLLLELNTTSAVVTRTRKVEVQEAKAVREPRPVEVNWVDLERDFYAEYLTWCKARAVLAGTPLGFSMQMPLRLASSCLPAAASQVLDWQPAGGDTGNDDGDGPEAGLTPSQQLPPHADLLVAAQRLGNRDTKFDQLVDVLTVMRPTNRQILLFTFSRATLDYLARRLAGQVRLAVLHGGVDKRTRHKVMADFRVGAYDLVLATRVASEGLDFEFCSILVNYDLPWNPMEVEQRIGRLDRIGQREEKILIVNFHTPDTIESRILDRILDRIGVFERSIGELEPIIQDQWLELRRVAFDFSLSEEQRALKTEQVLAAIETQGLNRQDLEAAADFLLTADEAPIDGMEDDLVRTGRYVGQQELALLLDDWARTAGAPPVEIDSANRVVRFRGVPAMAKSLEGLVQDGERSRAEIQESVSALRSEQDVYLALDPEVSRTKGLDLLTASHSLTRAAVRVAGHEQGRFARVRLDSAPEGVIPGQYAVQIAVATWTGLRPAREVWTAAVEVATGTAVPGVGDALFSAIANGELTEGQADGPALTDAVTQTSDLLLQRQVAEDAERREVNDALLDARRAGMHTMHQRKLEDLRARRSLLIDRGNTRMAALFDAQIGRELQRFVQLSAEIAERAESGLTTEPLAVCLVEVPGD